MNRLSIKMKRSFSFVSCLKQFSLHVFFAFLFSLSSVHEVLAQGGSTNSGGGGTGILLLNDEVILADPFVKKEIKNTKLFKFSLPEAVLAEARIAVQGMIAYAGYPYHPVYQAFYEQYVHGPTIEYYGVTELPDNCPYRTPVLVNTPEGGQKIPLLCSFENKTYVIEKYFKKMSIREQTKGVIHEAMRRFRSIVVDENQDNLIATITAGVDTILRLNNLERLSEQVILSQDDKDAITSMAKVIQDKQLINPDLLIPSGSSFGISLNEYEIKSFGGGLVHKNAKVDPSAYVGMSQVVGKDSELADNSSVRLSDSDVCLVSCQLSADAKIDHVRFYDQQLLRFVSLGSGALLFDSQFSSVRALSLSAQAKILHSAVMGDHQFGLEIDLGEQSVLSHFKRLILSEGLNWRLNLRAVAALATMSSALVIPLAGYAAIPSALSASRYESLLTTLIISNQIVWDGRNPSPCKSGEYAFKLHRKEKKIHSLDELNQLSCFRKQGIPLFFSEANHGLLGDLF